MRLERCLGAPGRRSAERVNGAPACCGAASGTEARPASAAAAAMKAGGGGPAGGGIPAADGPPDIGCMSQFWTLARSTWSFSGATPSTPVVRFISISFTVMNFFFLASRVGSLKSWSRSLASNSWAFMSGDSFARLAASGVASSTASCWGGGRSEAEAEDEDSSLLLSDSWSELPSAGPRSSPPLPGFAPASSPVPRAPGAAAAPSAPAAAAVFSLPADDGSLVLFASFLRCLDCASPESGTSNSTRLSSLSESARTASSTTRIGRLSTYLSVFPSSLASACLSLSPLSRTFHTLG
mmetsp:Transcript_25916/g.80863  ORF Transcript_25916/g.80863 Transcript_25916/m.80863 type:complete len:296 (-) Transcript_25916:711-1598(-)